MEKTAQDGFIAYGTLNIDLRQSTVRPGKDYTTNFEDWPKIQNGFDPKGIPCDGATCKCDPNCGMEPEVPDPKDKRGYYIRHLRHLSHHVHFDDLPQEFLNACLILKHLGGSY